MALTLAEPTEGEVLTSDQLTEALAANTAEQDALHAELDRLKQVRTGLLRQTHVTCTHNNFGNGCGGTSAIGELTYIQTHWYERPHGCMGGDTWHEGEGQYVCLHCGHRNRLYNRKDIGALRGYFKSVKPVHEH